MQVVESRYLTEDLRNFMNEHGWFELYGPAHPIECQRYIRRRMYDVTVRSKLEMRRTEVKKP